MSDQDNALTIDSQAINEALTAYLPPPNYSHQLRDGQKSTYFTPELWASICMRYSEGESIEAIAKSVNMPTSLLWQWSSTPGLAELWDKARKIHAHAIMDKSVHTWSTIKNGTWLTNMEKTGVDPNGGAMRAYVRALGDSIRFGMELAAKIDPDTYSDRLQIDKRQVSAVYVVAYDANQQIGHEPASIDVSAIPAPDKAGVERAKLTQSWRKAIAKERKLKLKQLESSDS